MSDETEVQREVTRRGDIVLRIDKGVARRTLKWAGLLAVLGTPAYLIAGSVDLNSFTASIVAGNTISATDVKGAFEALEDEVNDNFSRVAAAQSGADDAQTTADDAQTTADDAQTTANNAQSFANAAATAAGIAQTTANAAQTAAGTAQTTANAAQTAAGTAQTTADTADSKADANATTIATLTTRLAGLELAHTLTWLWSDPAKAHFTQTEVTASEFAACVAAGPCAGTFNSTAGCNLAADGTPLSGREDHPVNCVDWYGADAFCSWVGARLPDGAHTGNGYSYDGDWYLEASNNGTQTYPWGDTTPDCTHAVWKGSGNVCGVSSMAPVCSKSPTGDSVSGLCDMVGNVSEWTSTPDGSARVIRGGRWKANVASFIRADTRSPVQPDSRADDVGFRCARP